MTTRIAILSTFADACGGSEGRAIGLYRLLAPRADVELWTEQEPDPELARDWPIRRVRALRGAYPRDRDLIFVGAPRFGGWVRRSGAERITLIYNSNTPRRLARRLRRLRWAGEPGQGSAGGRCAVQVVFASQRLAATVPYHGTVQLSPIDLERFRPGPRAWTRLRVGRLSRDVRYKHGEEDPELYRRLADEGMRVRVRGGTCLVEELGDFPGVSLEAASPDAPDEFLRELDVFLYRTRADWYEASGRVVVEALATGLPIVAHRRGGHLDYLEHGENALLYDDDEEALEHLRRLRDDPELLAQMKAAARRSAEELYSPRALDQLARFYLEGAPQPCPG